MKSKELGDYAQNLSYLLWGHTKLVPTGSSYNDSHPKLPPPSLLFYSSSTPFDLGTQPKILNVGKGYMTNLHVNRMAYKGACWRGKHNGLTEISKGLIHRTFHGFSIMVLQGQLAVTITFLHKGTW